MKLIQFPTSHYCEKVRWVLDLTGRPYTVEVIGYRSPQHRALPARTGGSTVPVLVTDDGRWLRDSTTIVRALLDGPDAPALEPADAEDRARCRVWEDWADEALAGALYRLYVEAVTGDDALRRRAYDALLGHGPYAALYPVLGGVFASRWRAGAGVRPGRPGGRIRALEVFTLLDEALAGRPYLVGDTFTVADLTVATMLGLVHRPPAADPHPVVTPAGGTWRAPTLPAGDAVERVLAWQTRIYAEHRRPAAR